MAAASDIESSVADANTNGGLREMLVPARTPRQAIELARNYWGIEARFLRAETIREPSAGWLGFGRRNGLYRVVSAPHPEKQLLAEQLVRLLGAEAAAAVSAAPLGEATADGGGTVKPSRPLPAGSSLGPGQAGVRDGRLEIRGSALLIVPTGVDLYVNGKLRRGTTMVRDTDEVRVELPGAAAPQGFSISLTPDELWAMLEIRAGRSLRLRDAAPARPLLLEVEEIRVPPPGLNAEAVLGELSRLGVVQGIDLGAIDRAVRELPATPVVVARGEPAQPGRPARAEFLFESRPERQTLVRDDDRIDYRGVLHVPTVEADELLARKIPGEPGRPGRTVRGRELPPPPQAEVVLLAGYGARLEADGTVVRATASGRPQVQESAPGRYQVRVVPVLTHGSVDLSSGNLEFAGDIIIQGNVDESMSVVAGGDVTIYGSVSRAYVEAGGNLRVLGNSFNSTLVAGGRAAFFAAEQPLLERLVAALDTLQQAIDQVQNHPAFTEVMQDGGRFNLLVRLVVQARLRELPDLLRTLSASLAAIDRRDALTEGLRALVGRHSPQYRGVAFMSRAEVEAFRQMVLEAVGMARAAPRDRADVEVRYVHNCRVQALGSIRVGGEGSYYSDFHAGERFRSAGPVRGGRAMGQHGVAVSEAGSEVGVTTELATSASGTIRVGRAFPGVLLRVGRRVRRLEEVREGVVARMADDGVQLRRAT